MMRIGIFGGTFNPIHIGHLILAQEIQVKLRLDKVVFIPVFLPPHKKSISLANARHRYKMINLAIKGKSSFEVSDIELKRKGKSYSIDTLKTLKRIFGERAKFFFITGSDSLIELSSWKKVNEIFELSQFVIARRPGFTIKGVPIGTKIIDITQIDVSSSAIRKKIKKSVPIDYLVPKSVIDYISKERLYR